MPAASSSPATACSNIFHAPLRTDMSSIPFAKRSIATCRASLVAAFALACKDSRPCSVKAISMTFRRCAHAPCRSPRSSSCTPATSCMPVQTAASAALGRSPLKTCPTEEAVSFICAHTEPASFSVRSAFKADSKRFTSSPLPTSSDGKPLLRSCICRAALLSSSTGFCSTSGIAFPHRNRLRRRKGVTSSTSSSLLITPPSPTSDVAVLNSSNSICNLAMHGTFSPSGFFLV
mmetsp:Transcript_72917/g.136197  ORF Transcript_72917/g.136197 Transcript_72917/m.136197 type:complete len:233 (+) Transcript_72917:887-1585(+)